jgi:hypothetical protein
VIDSALTDAAMTGQESFSLTWLHSQSKLFLATLGHKLLCLCDSLYTGKKGKQAAQSLLKPSDFACLERGGVHPFLSVTVHID